MYISKLQASMAMYEARMFIKHYEKDGDAVQVKGFNDVRSSTQIGYQGIVPKILKSSDDVAHKLSLEAHIQPTQQTGGKGKKSIARALDIKSSNMSFSRQQIKEIFRYHDNNNDGFLNIMELTKAFAFLGSMFPFYKACYGMVYADANADGLISEAELDKLIDYATKIIKKK
ncbi:uncharacterized protein LOC107992099 [Cucumis melo]|uniref:Uncharacterized protein LOC107992099 n=1 Tax=Cucumis melo TaxID=3656 RepID=A0ABM3L8Z0_CUCME|nr:uncharacterized protein LOC107992099 [Cucumis melo]XP_050946487.1 uncharacterized protein LOC107992099 [Cucumis melo]